MIKSLKKHFFESQDKFKVSSIVQSASTGDISEIIKSLNVNKTKAPECIFVKSIKLLLSVFECCLANTTDNDDW